MQNIKEKSASDNYFVAVKCDEDDDSTGMLMSLIQPVKNSMPAYGNQYELFYANHRSKVEAINSFITGMEFDILVCMSDDMRFIQHEFDQKIRQDMPENLDCLLHYPDGYANEKLCTMSIIGRNYYKRDGYIYHPAYNSLWCDNEATEVAKRRGKYQYIPEQLVEHRHYANGKAGKDALYRRNDTYHADRLIYEERENINFDL